MTIIKRQAYIITTPLYVIVVLFGIVIVVVSLLTAGSGCGSSDSIHNNGGGTAIATATATTPCTTFVGGGVTAFVHSNTAVTVVGTITKSKYYTPLSTLTANKNNNNDNNDNRIIRSSSSRRRSKPYYDDFTNINAATLLSRSTQSSLASSSLVSLASTSSFELNNDDYSKNHNKRRHNIQIDHTVDDNTDTDTDTDNRKLVDVVQVTLPSMERYRNLTSLKSNNNNKSDATNNDHSDDFDDIYDDEKISLNPIIRKYRRLVSQRQKNDGQQLQQKQQVMKKFFVLRLLSYPFSLLFSIRRWCISIVSSQRKYYYYFRRNSNGYDDTFNRRKNANVTIGGKKRHLILLLSSMLSGMFGIRPVNIMCKSNGSGSGDVVASISRLEQTIHTHHHLDVSSYSSSSTTAYGREWLNKNKNKLEKKKKKKNKI